ncbi:spore germination protein [Alkaliphilus metalliredigens QYMF]|uniref:Spore germination protein n=1 Tax=Alkaliphilus metalliredigens (strain QYMF) TaxID=293826 RepID=A6TKM2_ALKMQ|nr:endospore germination permease [Alkaliphilus metalliredigens]ABR46740.1 spore germination protein [Alkaliphilus metalliredigens QYMF]
MYQKHKNGEITAIQSAIFLISIMIGTGILGLARSVAEVSNQDAWISVFINGLFISFVVMIIVYTVSKFPQHNFLQYNCYLLSKPLGYFVTLCYVIYAILVTAIITTFLTEMVYTWLLPNTPMTVIKLMIVITMVYMTRNGITTLARFTESIAFLLIPFAFLIFVGLPEASFINLRPIGGSGLSSIFKGTIPSFFAFAGYESLLVYYPYISNKQKPIMKYSISAIMIVTIFYTAVVMSQIALYGSDEIAVVLYPSINYLTAIDFPIIERTEIFFTIFWIFTVLATIGIQYLVAGILLQNIFQTKTTNIFVYALSPVIFLLSLYPKNTAVVVSLGEKIGQLNIFFGFLFPFLLLIMYLIKGKDNRHNKENRTG